MLAAVAGFLFGQAVFFYSLVQGAEAKRLIAVEVVRSPKAGAWSAGRTAEFEFLVKNLDNRSHVVNISIPSEDLTAFHPTAGESRLELSAGASGVLVAPIEQKEDLRIPALYVETIRVRFGVEGAPEGGVELALPVCAPVPEIGRPSVMVGPEQMAGARRKMAESEWARERCDRFLKAASAWLDTAVAIPAGPGGASAWYVCEKCGADLMEKKPQGHLCTGCGGVYHGEPYDSALIAREHQRLARGARDLGLAYAFTGDIAYARKCVEVLLGYAARYKGYRMQERHGARAGDGAQAPRPDVALVNAQALDEAKWAVALAEAYDFIADSGALNKGQKRRVEGDLLRAAAQTIEGELSKIGTDPIFPHVLCWRMAAVGIIGFSIRDGDLAYRAIEGEDGMRRRMIEGIGHDGTWREGVWRCHLQAMEAMAVLAESASHFGVELFSSQLEKMLDAPILAMTPDRRLPPMEGALGEESGAAWAYEVARGHYPDDVLMAWLLSRSARSGIEAVLYGDSPEIGVQSPPALTTALFSEGGLAILRSRGGAPIYVGLNYGTQGEWPGHRDKLDFSLYGQGRERCVDGEGNTHSGAAQEKWYRQTIGHNAVVVDQKSQMAGQGILDFIQSTAHFQLASATSDNIFPGVLCDRFVGVIGDRCVLVVDRVLGTRERTYDWALHCRGQMRAEGPAVPLARPLGATDGYEMLQNLARLTTGEAVRAEFSCEDGTGLSVLMPAGKGSEVFTGAGMGRFPGESVPLIIARQRAYGACFVAVLEPWRGSSTIEEFTAGRVQMAGGQETTGYDIWVDIKGKGWTGQGIISYNEGVKWSRAGLETDGRVGFVLTEAGAPPVGTVVGGERLVLKGVPVEIEALSPVLNQE